ncbi:MAG: hypothetical protein WC875_01045 [Candidatus Absconditabacterales bacterium]
MNIEKEKDISGSAKENSDNLESSFDAMKEHIKEIEQREEIAADKEDLQKLRNEIQEADKWVETRKRGNIETLKHGNVTEFISSQDEKLLIRSIKTINSWIDAHPDRPGKEIKDAALEPLRTIIASTQDPNPIARVIGHIMKRIMNA